jgi:DNA-binding NarL/FixJ family response regulator
MVRILVADDQAVVCAGIKQILEAGGPFRIIDQVSDAVELLNNLRVYPARYDILIMDALISGLDAFGMIREIRSMQPDLSLVIFTGRSEETYALRFFRSGASAFIRKDSTPSDLLLAIKTVASGRKYYSPRQVELMGDLLLGSTRKREGSSDQLTEREMQVMQLIASGEMKEDIARRLTVSKNTVSNHRSNILKKLKLRNNAEIARYALLNGFER